MQTSIINNISFLLFSFTSVPETCFLSSSHAIFNCATSASYFAAADTALSYYTNIELFSSDKLSIRCFKSLLLLNRRSFWDCNCESISEKLVICAPISAFFISNSSICDSSATFSEILRDILPNSVILLVDSKLWSLLAS